MSPQDPNLQKYIMNFQNVSQHKWSLAPFWVPTLSLGMSAANTAKKFDLCFFHVSDSNSFSTFRKCQKVLGKNMELWENEVYRFKTIGQLKVGEKVWFTSFVPFIRQKSPIVTAPRSLISGHQSVFAPRGSASQTSHL